MIRSIDSGCPFLLLVVICGGGWFRWALNFVVSRWIALRRQLAIKTDAGWVICKENFIMHLLEPDTSQGLNSGEVKIDSPRSSRDEGGETTKH